VSRVLGDASEHVGQPSLWIHVVHLCRDDEAVHGGGPLSAAIGTGEEPRLSAEGHCPFILPMSGESWKSITAGIPILAARSVSGASRRERRADF
jgi:hypothetical protein